MNKLDYDTWSLASYYIPAEKPIERTFNNIVYKVNNAVLYRTSFKHFIDTKRISVWIYDLAGKIIKKDYVNASIYLDDLKVYAYKLMEQLYANRPPAPKKTPRLHSIIEEREIIKAHNQLDKLNQEYDNVQYSELLRVVIRNKIVKIIVSFNKKYGVDIL